MLEQPVSQTDRKKKGEGASAALDLINGMGVCIKSQL